MIKIVKYRDQEKNTWNEFVNNSKNGTFMFNREYMDYHSDRFNDNSLMFYDEKDKLIALLPANIDNNTLYSHQGLTYGGFVVDYKMTMQKMLLLFEALQHYIQVSNIMNGLIYKRIPSIYQQYPSDEDLYALFRINANLIRRDVTTSVALSNKIKFNERRKRNIKKAFKNNLSFCETNDYQTYLNILSDVLKKYNTKPVHSLQELLYLSSKFPQNIKLYSAFKDNTMLAGVLIYETSTVAHAQYIASTIEGKNCGALDFIFDKLINEIYKEKIYFDFGISTEQNGQYLNEGLITQKQEFGGRAIVHDFYEIKYKRK